MIMEKTIEALDLGGKIYLGVNSIVLLMGIIHIVAMIILIIEVKKLNLARKEIVEDIRKDIIKILKD